MAKSKSSTKAGARRLKAGAKPASAAKPVVAAAAVKKSVPPTRKRSRATGVGATAAGSAADQKKPRAERGSAGAPRAKRGAAGAPRAGGESTESAATASRTAGKALVIVESPTKSRTLTKFLGRGFAVMASNGHIMDLPKSKLGVDLENGFEPQYEPIKTKQATLAKLQQAARTASRIYLAPDPDREGEAIAWHLAGALKSAKRPVQRLTFNEITERAVQQALEHPRELDLNLVNAQQARRVLDRLVGYKVSPFLWKTMFFGLSAGRVQSVALRLICEREDAIEKFVAVEYWTLEVDYQNAAGDRLTARLARVGEEELEQSQLRGDQAPALAQQLATELRGVGARVADVQTTPKQVHPRPPFITSTLQQTAFNRLGFTSQRTMKIAQQLYEGVALGPQGSVGLITYMRTDSPRLAGEAIGEMRQWIGAQLGADYVPESPRQFKGKKSAQDAHEAIRPTAAERTPDSLRPFLTEEQFKLYDLIWKRAVASQAASAEYLATSVEIEAGRLGLRASGRVLKFAGFQKLYGLDEEDDEKDSRLPALTSGEPLSVARQPIGEEADAVRPLQHFTQPPPRYTEASLVKSLEEENIGRPSTYATIVTTITSRKYVIRDKGRLVPTDVGRAVNKLLVSTFPDVFDVTFTATMEEELDGIEEGQLDWHKVVQDFWDPLSRDLDQAEKVVSHHRKKVEEVSDIPCPNCGKLLVRKFGRRGAFLACPGYPECKFTRPVDDSELPVPVEGKCDLCGSPLVARNGPYGRFISCSRRPDCKFTKKMTLGIKCPDCGLGEIAEKRTKRGKLFYSCTRYPECKFAAWDKPRLIPCPNCQSPFLVEKETKKGLTLRCVKCKSTFQPEAVGA